MVLNILGEDLDLQPNSNYTFILERQKGIIQPVSQLFPFVEHGYCVRQIYNNMKQIYRGRIYKDFLWRYATTTIAAQFEKLMDDLKCFNPKLMYGFKRYHIHLGQGKAMCDILVNNICEELNNKLVDGRDQPIIGCLEYNRVFDKENSECPRDQQPSGNTKKKSRPDGVQDVEPTEVVRGSSQVMDSEPSRSQTRKSGSPSHALDSQPTTSQKRKSSTSSHANLSQPSGIRARKSDRHASKEPAV
ncbi:hypothetical protein Tco_0833102 [Tanacetum coccineum]